MPPYSRELQIALAAVREASQLCRTVQATITNEVLDKKDMSPVTVADYGSQALICRALGSAFPNDPVVAEEDSASLKLPENERFLGDVLQLVRGLGHGTNVAEVCSWIDRGGASDFTSRFWTLDPIDGTKGFLRKGQYAISLALIVDGRIDVGVLGCPNLPVSAEAGSPKGCLFYAVRGQGAFALALDEDRPAWPIRVSSNTKPVRFCESVESGHSAHDESAEVARRLGITADPVRMDSQAKYASVARGDADAYLRLPTKPGYFEMIWDHAGGVLVAEEAGGRVTDVTGKPLDFTHGRRLTQNKGVIVTNGRLHDQIVTTVQAVMSESGLSRTA